MTALSDLFAAYKVLSLQPVRGTRYRFLLYDGLVPLHVALGVNNVKIRIHIARAPAEYAVSVLFSDV
eukprot:scaffold6825_cov50-Cylindrotheca_fusiformis.AAC.2